MMSLKINTTVDVDDRIQSLLERQAAIQAQDADIKAQLASLLPSSAPPSQHHRSPIHKRRSNVPRSISNGGSTMARHLSSDRTHHDTSRRSRTLSQQSAPSMARTNSKGASSVRSSNLPFTSNGMMPPPVYSSESRQANPVEAWVGRDQPLSAYNLTHTPVLQRSLSQRKPDLEQVPELDNIGENPGDFLCRTGAPMLSLTPSPITIPTSTMTSQNRHRPSISSRQSQTFGIQTPSTPTTDSLTNATTLASNMSRQNSLSQDAVLGGMQMMSVNSNTSHFTDDKVNDDTMYHQVPHYSSSQSTRLSLKDERSLLLVGAGGASDESQFSLSFRTAEPMAQFSSSGSFVEEMQRSQSNESNSSTSSSQSRNKLRLQIQNQQALVRPLKPKAGSDDSTTMSRENSSQSITQLESNGSQDKAVIPKTTYQRPKHDPVFCKLCDEHPDGFRGEHELRRHHNRQHKALVKKWVCVEPVDCHNRPKPVYPLSKCKSCSQTKKYGAYYNAAAHLRRAHFKPKVRCRSKGNKVEDKPEKRGGNGGGDWPPMTELKYWMREVEEPAADYPVSQQEDDESEDEYYEHALEEHLSAVPASSANIPVTGSSFDTPFLSEASMLDVFPTTVAHSAHRACSLIFLYSRTLTSQCPTIRVKQVLILSLYYRMTLWHSLKILPFLRLMMTTRLVSIL